MHWLNASDDARRRPALRKARAILEGEQPEVWACLQHQPLQSILFRHLLPQPPSSRSTLRSHACTGRSRSPVWNGWGGGNWASGKTANLFLRTFINSYTQHPSRVLAFEASSEILRAFIIYDPAFRNSKSTYQAHSLIIETIQDGHDDIRTGVMTRCLSAWMIYE